MTQIRFKTTRKIVLKEIRVGTPIKTVTAGSFGINNLGGVNTSGRTTGTLLAFNQSSGNYEPVQLTGDSNHFITFDSGGNPDTLQINFTNDSISGSLIPKLDSAFDLGSSTKKWKNLFLSGSTINLGDLTIASTGGGIEVKDSDGNVLLQNLKYISVNGDTDILSYDSSTSTFTFNDSDVARTDEIETFHKGVTFADSATFSSNVSVAGNLSITGDLSYDDVSADSAVFSGSVAIGNNLTADSATIPTIATTTINADQQFTDSATITNLANSTLTAKVITNTTLATDSATIGNVAVTTQLTGNQASFDSVASNTLHATAVSSQTLSADSGDIRQLSVDFINADSAFLDSATITNLSTTQITLSQMTLDSATVNNLNADSSDIRQVSTEFINFDSAFGDSATITNIANSVLTAKAITGTSADIDSATIGNIAITNAVISSGDSATFTNIANTQLTGSQATLDSATITKLNVDSSDIDHLSTEAINFDSATGDSATITSIANSTFTGKVITGTNVAFDSATVTNVAIATQLTGDQASFDSVATNTLHATNLSVDSGDIRQLSVDFINADSATFDSATIGSLAVGTLNIDAIDIGDSASFTNLATTQIIGSQAKFDSATISGIQLASNNDITTTGKIYFANLFSTEGDLPSASTYHGMFAHVHGTGKAYFSHAGAWHQLLDKGSANDSATITNLANSVLTAKAITNTTLVGDSATITNIANDVLTAKAITNTTQVGDSATITNIANTTLTGKNATFDSATITNIANSVLTAKAITNTTQVGDSATITNIANSVLTAKAITGTTVTTSGDIVSSGTIRVGNLNVDSADIIKISRDNLASGTGVTYDSSTGNISIGQSVGTSDSVTFSGLTIGGDLVVSGTTTTVASTNTTMTDQLFELGNGRTGSPSGDAGIIIEMGDDSNAFIGFDQSLGKFIVSRTNATGSSTGNLVHTTAPLVAGAIDVDSASIDSATITNLASTQFTGSQATIDSADIRVLTGDSAVFSSAIQTPKIITPAFTLDSNQFFPGPTNTININNSTNAVKVGINMLNNTGEGSLSTDALAVKGDAYFLDYSAGHSFRIVSDTNPIKLRADDRTGGGFAGIDFVAGNGNPASDQTRMKITTGGVLELQGDMTRTSGDMTFDMPANIVLDADGGSIKLSDGGTQFGELLTSSSDFLIDAKVQDKDIIFRGNDGGSVITALTLDMSNVGDAVFRRQVTLREALYINKADNSATVGLLQNSGDDFVVRNFVATGDIIFKTNATERLKIDASGLVTAASVNFGDKFETTDSGVSVTGQLLADSATLTNLTVDSADIRQLSVDFINADSAFLDSATITTLAVGTLNIDNINIGDSATFTNVAVSTVLNTNQLIVDDITIDGSSIADAGDFSLDIEGDITFDANGGNVKLSDDGLLFTTISRDAANTVIKVNQSDGDLVLKGNDGGSEISALTLDMSDAGRALFNGSVDMGGGLITRTGDLTLDVSGDLILDAGGENIKFHDDGTEIGQIDMGSQNLTFRSSVSDKDIIFRVNDGGSEIAAMTIDASEAGQVLIAGDLRVGNLPVDSADLITLARSNISGRNGLAYNSSTGVFDLDSANAITTVKNALSTGSPDALTYDSAAGQFALNANHVMALIQTVDSNGSGLNADTLDGQSGSHYRINVFNASGTLLN